MQYAQVLINSKTDKLDKAFTYQIPPKILPYIKIGSMVKIPFGPRDKKGIVFKIIRSVPSDIKYKLKPIKSLEFNTAVLNENQIKLAQMISNYYLINLGQLVFFMIPNLSKRLLKKSSTNQSTSYQNETSYYLKHQKNYAIFDTKENRIKHYIKLINKAFKKNKSVILLFPDFCANEIFIDLVAKNFKNKSIIFSPHDKTTSTTKKWISLIDNRCSLVMGTRNTIFQIPNNLGLVVVDEPNHYGYKEEQTTHHNAKKIAELLSKTTGANLVFGDNYPEIKEYFSKNIKKLIFNKNFITNKKIVILDNSQNKSNYFSYPIENLISQHIDKKQHILILTRGHGISAGLICTQCQELIYCPRCKRIMFKTQENTKMLNCPMCNYELAIPKKCPNCQGNEFSEFGLPTQKLANIIKEKFPNQTIKILKDDRDFVDTSLYNNYVFVSSNYALSWKNLHFQSIIVLDWENWQFSSGYDYYQKFVKSFVDLCEMSDKNIYIQTINPDDENLKKIVALKIDDIYKKDLYMRNKFTYPPFYDVIKISYKDFNNKKSQDEIKNINNKITKLFKNCIISEIINEGKKRDKYYCNFIIKTKIENSYQTKRILLNNYKKLELSKYIVDVEPLRII